MSLFSLHFIISPMIKTRAKAATPQTTKMITVLPGQWHTHRQIHRKWRHMVSRAVDSMPLYTFLKSYHVTEVYRWMDLLFTDSVYGLESQQRWEQFTEQMYMSGIESAFSIRKVLFPPFSTASFFFHWNITVEFPHFSLHVRVMSSPSFGLDGSLLMDTSSDGQSKHEKRGKQQ